MAKGDLDDGAGMSRKEAGASEFVKRLFAMLEDRSHDNVVAWSASGDTFAVKDMNEFTKTILPKHFKHSNFASFVRGPLSSLERRFKAFQVRQLNKYDFHKVKNPESTETGIYGDHTWEFRHPHFREDMRDALENIKRKGPAPRKALAKGSPIDQSTSAGSADRFSSMQQQIDMFAQDQHNLNVHVGNLTREYNNVISEVNYLQRINSHQNHIIQCLIQYVADSEKKAAGIPDNDTSFLPSGDVQRMMGTFNEIARMSPPEPLQDPYNRPTFVSGRLLPGGRQFIPSPPEGSTSPTQAQPNEDSNPGSAAVAKLPPVDVVSKVMFNNGMPHGPPTGVHVPSHPHSQPSFTPSSHAPTPNLPIPPMQPPSPPGRARKAPTWSIRPKVLLVEDDAVCRKLSSKFLQVFGCTIDVAEDGVSAVAKMNAEKYDLVFMDINMPNLDGVSATSLIRQFDPMTPIISMTSASNPNEVLTYFAHGMNDVLPKPFTKEGLLEMLDKHVSHLKQMQTLTEIPRALGIPDDAIQHALVSTFNDPSAPFADLLTGMGSNSENGNYVHMLASLVNGSNSEAPNRPTKRELSDISPNGPSKRQHL